MEQAPLLQGCVVTLLEFDVRLFKLRFELDDLELVINALCYMKSHDLVEEG